jgi:hypothetical protein
MPQASLRALRATPPGSDRIPVYASAPLVLTSARSAATLSRRTPMTALALIRASMHSLIPTCELAHRHLPC